MLIFERYGSNLTFITGLPVRLACKTLLFLQFRIYSFGVNGGMSEIVKVENLKDGLILARGIYLNSAVLFRSGTYVTSALIEDLKEKGVREACVEPDPPGPFQSFFLNKQDMPPHQSSSLTERFQNDMAVIADELRYGRILHSEVSYNWLHSVYLRLFSNPTVSLLMNSLKQWDPICYYHSVDVFVLCILLGHRLKWQMDEGFMLGCLMHDIGKLYTPCTILLKTGKLTEREFEKVKKHTVAGSQLLQRLKFPSMAAGIARSHHERLDGSGYPDHTSVSKERVMLRAIMIADVYSALTLNRSYRKPMHATKAMQILLNDCMRGKFALEECYRFINFISIFPPATRVLLTDGQVGTVLSSKNGSDILPKVKIQNRSKVIQLPSDLSLTVKKVIGWDNREMELQARQNWRDYLQNLIDGNPNQAMALLDELSDGKRIERVYTDVIEHSMNEIRQGVASKTYYPSDLPIAVNTTLTLLHWKMLKLLRHPVYNMGSVIITGFGSTGDSLQMKMMNDLLAINGWKTYLLGSSADTSMIADLIQRKGIRYLAGVLSGSDDRFTALSMYKTLIGQFSNLVLFIHSQEMPIFQGLSNDRILESSDLSGFIANLKKCFPVRHSAM
ncbi:HD domain-containing protein [Sporolactobacillus sp. THM7-7]|nr:HD domain-containing protein [Sporolactobacillus sp. THM7-7]